MTAEDRPRGWQPMPATGEHDPEATAFIQLPPDFGDPAGAGRGATLAAPGHGYAPPPIASASADPAETGQFRIPDFGTAEHTGSWQIPTNSLPHPADGEGSREEGQISDWQQLPAEPAPALELEPEPEPQAYAPSPAPDVETPHDEHPRASYVLRVNDADRPVTDAWIGESLLYVLRERLGLAGAKDGCSQGECGACNVKVDGRLVASCLVPAATAAEAEIRTVEGLAKDGLASDVQRALASCGAVQCGFCIPGIAMTVHDLLEGNHAPTELETRQALCGNLCRCTGYQGVLSAVREVIAGRDTKPAQAEDPAATAHIPQQAAPGEGGVSPGPGAHMPPPRRPAPQEGA